MNTSSNQARAIFLQVIEQDSPENRAAVLERACEGYPELRARVQRLLRSHELLGSFHDAPGLNGEAINLPVTEAPGDTIGPYKLLQQIGEGGMGVVFMAEQERPVRRKAALKIIKPGMDTREVIARFEAERQALALMDHPNIAKVHDAGTTENGRPYFVMELVQGVPITDYCDQCNLPTGERLELFVLVCQAVQHAHQKGVIHRDLKPTNVLVSMQDGRPCPKIIDFGVAKAIHQRLTEHTLTTAYAQIVGTPLYMSPEQAELSPLGVDTRSDIYSLGVLLYELLTGVTPFDKDHLYSAPYDELRRIIREEEPPRPSTRLSTLDANLATTVAEHRRTDARRLRQTVRGELDWIVMKCLEKDRNRRYETPSNLARDIECYLHDEPVQACPPSTSYRFRKFARRNKTLLAAGVAVASALVIGLGLSTWMYLREREAMQVASAWEFFVVAIAQLHAGDQAGYRATCKTLAEVPVDSVDDDTKVRQIHAWTLAPDALEDMSLVVKRAEELAANNSVGQPHIVLYVLGAALYRDGQYDRAADELKKSIAAYPSDPWLGLQTINCQRLMLAMTQWKLAHKDEARRLLAETEPAVDQEISTAYFVFKSALEVLRREAETLIQPKEADEAVENKSRTSSPTTDR